MEIQYHGHSCFELRDGEHTLLVDPFLAPNNPKAVASANDVSPTHIAITHAHADHVADAVAVATRTGAECVAVVELAEWLKAQGGKIALRKLNAPKIIGGLPNPGYAG